MEHLMWILSFFIVLLHLSSLALLSGALFERRLRNPLHWLCMLAAGLLLYSCLIFLPSGTSFIRIAAYFCINFAVVCFYRGKLPVRLCVAVMHYIMLTGLEMVVLPALLTLGEIPLHQLRQSSVLVTVVYVLPGTVLFVGSLLLSRVFRSWKNQIELPASQWLAIFLFAAFTLFELYFASVLISTDSPYLLLLPILGVVLLFMNIGLLLLLNKLAAHHRMDRENFALQEQMRYNRMSMQAATESYEVQRSLTHDFDNQLLTIVQLLQSGQSEEALAYAQTVANTVGAAEIAVSTNNPIADAVLNQKYRKAQELGVQMQFLVSDLSEFPLSTDEMVTVLANLLDNALEACGAVEATQKKSIRVKLLMESALATLSVQNTSLPVVISLEGEIATTKHKQAEHGYGLRTCKKVLKRSGFEFAMQYKDGWVQFTAIKSL